MKTWNKVISIIFMLGAIFMLIKWFEILIKTGESKPFAIGLMFICIIMGLIFRFMAKGY